MTVQGATIPCIKLFAACVSEEARRGSEALIVPLRECPIASIGWRNSWAVSVFRMCNWALRFRTEFRPLIFSRNCCSEFWSHHYVSQVTPFAPEICYLYRPVVGMRLRHA